MIAIITSVYGESLMALKKLSELLSHAQKEGYAVGYFEAWSFFAFPRRSMPQ